MTGSLGTIYAEIRLKLEQFKKDIDNASTEIKTMQDNVNKSLSAFTELGNSMKKVGGSLSKYVTAPIVGLGTAAVYTGAKFGAAMAEVMAISGATGAEFEALRIKARDLGSTTKFTAIQAAEGMTMLARAGFDTNEILSAIPGMLSLAAAGNLDLAVAADIVSDTMMAFGESAAQAGRYADVFAKAAASGNTTVEGLGEAMSYGAATAAAMGMAVEEATAIMTAFADAGIKSTRAGTTFEAVMRDLRQTAMANGGALTYLTKAGEEVSIAWYDAAGNARPFLEVLSELESSLEGATTAERDFAMSQLVSTAGMRGLNILLTRGSENLRELTDELYNSEGAADAMSEMMLDNLAGSLTILKSAISEVMLQFSDILAPVIRKVVEGLTKFAQWFGELPTGIKKVIAVVLTLVAAMGPLLVIFGAFLTMIPTMVKGWAILKGAMMVVILPAIKIVAIIAAIIAISVALYKNWAKLKKFAGNLWEGIKSGWTAVFEGIKSLFTGIIDFFKGNWQGILLLIVNPFVGAFKLLYDNVEGFRIFIDNAFSSVRDSIGSVIESVVTWFVELPGNIVGAINSFVEIVQVGIENVVTFFSELPGKVLTFLQELFFEYIPYWVGYGLGTMVRLVTEGIEKTVTLFSELPGKVWIWLQELWTKIYETVSSIWETATTWISNTVNDIVELFKTLPGRIWEWLTQAYNNVVQWGTDVYVTAVSKISKTITDVVNWFKELPTRIWTCLIDVLSRISQWSINAYVAMRTAARDMVDGFMDWINKLPSMVWESLMNVVDTILSTATALKNAAKRAATSLWNGFKSGLGIKSPSYLEEAMMNIMDKSYDMTTQLAGDFRKLSRMSVKPEITPFLSNQERYPNWGGGGLVGVGGFSGPLIQIEKMEVRSDDDIKRLSRELKGHIDDVLRGEGYK